MGHVDAVLRVKTFWLHLLGIDGYEKDNLIELRLPQRKVEGIGADIFDAKHCQAVKEVLGLRQVRALLVVLPCSY